MPPSRVGARVYKTHGSLESTKSCFREVFIELKDFLYKAKRKIGIPKMQKNPDKNFTTVEVDPVTGEYYVVLPEWVLSEYGWYEGTEVNMEIDGDCIVITEVK